MDGMYKEYRIYEIKNWIEGIYECVIYTLRSGWYVKYEYVKYEYVKYEYVKFSYIFYQYSMLNMSM